MNWSRLSAFLPPAAFVDSKLPLLEGQLVLDDHGETPVPVGVGADGSPMPTQWVLSPPRVSGLS